MPRFYFHTDDGSRFSDEDGTELPNLAAARNAALQFLCESLKDQPEDLWQTGDWRVIVTDATRLTLFTIEVHLTIAPAGG